MTAQNEDDMIKPRIGSHLDALLREDGVLESATATAITRVTAWQAGRVTREAELAAQDYEAFLRGKVETARRSVADGQGPANAEVEAIFATRRAGSTSGT